MATALSEAEQQIAAIVAAAAAAAITEATKQTFNSSVPFPEPLCMTGNLRQNIDDFCDGFDVYSVASGLEHREERVKIATFKAALGLDARKVFNNWPLQEEEKNSVNACLESLKKYMVPKKNVKLARYEFLQCKQKAADGASDGESVSQFINRARALAKDCNWGNLEEEMLRDVIVAGLRDVRLKKSFIDRPELSATEVINQCMSDEATKAELDRNKWLEDEQQFVNKVYNKSKKPKQCAYCGNAYHRDLLDCPARGNTCFYCRQRNHFEIVCKKKKEDADKERKKNSSVRAGYSGRKVHTINGKDSDDCDTEEDEEANEEVIDSIEFLYCVEQSRSKLLKAELMFWCEGKKARQVKCTLDTGASCNVIGLPTLLEILNVKSVELDKYKTVLKSFGGSTITTMGRATVNVEHRGKRFKAVFNVVKFPQMPILSLYSCQKLELLKLCFTVDEQLEVVAENIVSRYPGVFQGIGEMQGEVHLEVDSSVEPVIQPARRIPVTLRDELKQQLDEMEKLNIVAKITEPTEWVSNLVLVKRNDKIRICIDPIMLNSALKRPHYQIPTVNELLPELANAKIFSTVDAKSGFWQVKLDEQSSRLTTFWTPYGRYRWLRMPFGISPAPEIFQRKLHEAVEGLNGVRVLADDVLIFGCGDSNEEALRDHNNNLNNFLKRMSETNIKLNKDKIRLCQSTVKFFGHILTPEGVKPDPDKIRSIVQMSRPTNVTAVLRFLGMITYLANYLPKLSTVAEPLRKLTIKNAPFEWSGEQQLAFDRLKTMVTQAPVLKYFNVRKDVVIQCDSSSTGLGAVLLQNGLPVCYASKSLTPTERRYAQIEKETLAILFACRKFELYIVGKEVTVQTDHLPLLRIFKKPLCEAPMRLQRMLLGLQRYKLKLLFKPGKEIVIADMLSRAALAEDDNTEKGIYDIYTIDMDFTFEDFEQVNAVEYIPVSDLRLEQIRRESLSDPDIQMLIQFIIEGWPDVKKELPDQLRVFWKHRDELYTQNGLIYRNNRILIPTKIRAEILERLHSSHSGIVATIKLARDTVFWPGINEQIRHRVQNCLTCLKYSPNQQNQPMQTHPIPCYPYQKISLDLFEVQWNGRKHVYLVTVDHFSDFIDVDELTGDMTASKVIQKCRQNFARYGTPMYVTSDGGPQFTGLEFKKLAEEWEFQHTISAPHHQQGNGKAEAAVKIVKRMLKKSLETNTDFWKALQQWRNVPNNCGSSPAQRMFNRRTRFNVPMAEVQYSPKIQEGVKEQIKRNRQTAKYYYDRSVKVLPALEVGQRVLIKRKPTDKQWHPGTVQDIVTDRSTLVDIGGQHLVRDNVMIKPAPQQDSKAVTTSGASPKARPEADHRTSENLGRNSSTLATSEESKTTDPASVLSKDRPVNDMREARPRREVKLPKRFDDYNMY